MDNSYAKLQVCLCLNVASEEFDPCFGWRNIVEIVTLRKGTVRWQIGIGRSARVESVG